MPTKKSQSYWVYILLCSNESYYTGYTDNLSRRYQSHLDGSGGCKYTRSFKPIKIAQCWQVASKSLAMRLEALVKGMSRTEKQKLIKTPAKLSDDERVTLVPKKARLRAQECYVSRLCDVPC